jgi:predicted RNase H-like nuclease (RuvC/YqgF family)
MQARQDYPRGTLCNQGSSLSGFGSGSGATMTDDEKTRNLQDKVYRLKLQVKYLQKRNKEQKQWINKLTNKNHPARRAGK